MSRKSKKQRNAEQAVRQQEVRDTNKANRRPTRDDLARILLWKMIMAAHEQKDTEGTLGKLLNSLLVDLVRQRFDVKESDDVFYELADRYSNGVYPFRPKRHLMPK